MHLRNLVSYTMQMDAPKTLGIARIREERLARIWDTHVSQLTGFVHDLRSEKGAGYSIPYFDPMDGGIDAECLFLLEAPGPKAVASGFVSRNNPDETAKNFFLLNIEAGIDRKKTVLWNIVPWYIGTGKRIRPANKGDLGAAEPALAKLIALLPALRLIVLVGRKAASAETAVKCLVKDGSVRVMPHPSPMFVNRAPENREAILSKLRSVAQELQSSNYDGR